MLTYDMEDRGGTPLYEYLYRCIREDIRSGALRRGRSCPPSGPWRSTCG